MADVIPFPTGPDALQDLDLFTAVDVAIRDLRDIGRQCGDSSASARADECRRMLERALRAALCGE